MAGFFSGLGRSSGNPEAKSAQKNSKNKASAKSSKKTASGTPKPKDEQNSPIPTNRSNSKDRSNTMRLSKNSPPKKDEDFDIPTDAAIPGFPSSAKQGSSDVRSLGPTAVIGPKIRFKGELSGEEDLIVEGKIEGSITLRANQLTIGKQGSIQANVIAKNITVEGSVEGDLTATDRVNIKASSEVLGNVKAGRVTLEDGAKFRGSIDMDSKSASPSSSRDKARAASNSSADPVKA